MKKKILFIFTIVFFLSATMLLTSCGEKPFVFYGEDKYEMKESPFLSDFHNLDLKGMGFQKVVSELPPFPTDSPDTVSFFPKSNDGHVSTSLFYLHQAPMTYKEEGGSTRNATAWWRPNSGDAGIYRIVIRATDSEGLYSEQIVTVTVIESSNVPPVLFAKYVAEKK